VVSYPHFWMNFTGGWAQARKALEPRFAKLLLDRGADPQARASFRLAVGSDEAPDFRDFRDLTPLAWGARFPDQRVVNSAAIELLAAVVRAPRAGPGEPL